MSSIPPTPWSAKSARVCWMSCPNPEEPEAYLAKKDDNKSTGDEWMKSNRRWFLSLFLLLALIPLARAQEEQTRVQDVIYAKKMGVALTMDVFKPAQPNGIGVIWMVSGGWISNHSGINPEMAKVFTKRGQTV